SDLSERLQRGPERIESEAPPETVQQKVGGEPEAQPKPAAQREGRRRPRTGRDSQGRKSRGQKKAAAPHGEVNGNVAAPAAQKPKPKPKPKSKAKNKPARAGNEANSKAGLRGPGRRSGGQGRRKSDVRFPSDYANGPRASQSPAEAAEQHREVKRHEPMQYLADYGFSSGPRTRKPVTVVYRGKGRKSVRREGEDGDES
ncbi:MAG: hypothetical protein P8Y78_08780, partial [Acidihalobacter sp.]